MAKGGRKALWPEALKCRGYYLLAAGAMAERRAADRGGPTSVRERASRSWRPGQRRRANHGR